MDAITTLEVAAVALIPAITVLTEVLKRVKVSPVNGDNAKTSVVVLTTLFICGMYYSNGTLVAENVDIIALNIGVYSVGAVGVYEFTKKLIKKIVN